MQISLPEEVMKNLPDPDSQGIVRVTAALKVQPDGQAELVELNDIPVGDEPGNEDDTPMKEEDMPSADEMERKIYSGDQE